MRKFLLLLCMAAIGCVTSSAREVTLAEATRIAASHRSTVATGKALAKSVSSPELAYTEYADGQPLYYIFNRPGSGYVIVAADDKASAVLAYSDTQAFTSINAVPENMKAWLDDYAMQIRQAKSTPAARAPRRAPRTAISPLLQTKWGQEEPFNNLCPMVTLRTPEADKTEARSVVGCVGTAMAQMMKYYNYPATAQGEITYIWERRDGGENEPIIYSFEGHTYDWDNMLNKYKGITATEAQKNAVAQLSADCSYSVEMQFDEEGSGAATMLVPYAMSKYFGYDSAMFYEDRPFYSDEEWEDIIYAELAAQRPVMYCGTTPSGSSHTWIIDGIDNDGLFHINWGWEEFEDGYFALTGTEILNPAAGGTGGASYREGFSLSQGCITGIQPNVGGTPRLDFTSTVPEVLNIQEMTRPFVMTPDMSSDDIWLTLYGKFLNNSTFGVDVYCDFGIKLRNRQTGEEQLFKMPFVNNAPQLVSAWTGLQSISILRSELNYLPSGEYEVTPVYRDYIYENNGGEISILQNGDWKEFRYYKEAGQEVTLNLSGEVPDLYIVEELENTVPLIDHLEFKMTLHANRNVFGYLVPMLFEHNESTDAEGNPVEAWYAYNDRLNAASIPIEMTAGESRLITLGPWQYNTASEVMPMFLSKIFLAPLSTTPWNEATALEPVIKNQAVFTAQPSTAISSVKQSKLTAPLDIFTLDGRHVGTNASRNALKPGMYVIGGRKVVIK